MAEMTRWTRLVSGVMALLLLVACGTAPTSGGENGQEMDEAAATPEPTPVTLAMGYIPNVQFAPFYVAVEKGFFAEEGIELTFDYGMENDLVQLVAANELQFAVASGDQVLLGRSQGLPIRYVGNWYRRFPVAVTAIEHDLSDPAALEGMTVGLPGLFGASYIGWLALVHAAGIDAEQVQLEAIGFNQVPVLAEGQVDAVVVYATNEPLKLAAEGYEPSTLYVADFIDLVANGLISNDATIESNPELVRGMVQAMTRGIQYTLDNPDETFEIVTSERWVPEAGGENAAAERQVFDATLDYFRNERIGTVPASAWEASAAFMVEAGLLESAPALGDVYTDEFVP